MAAPPMPTPPRKIRTLDRDLAPGAVGARLPIHVVCDNLRSAYNVGAIFRSADACRIAAVHLCGITARPPHAKLDKTALGTPDYVPWRPWDRAVDAIRHLQGEGVAVAGVEVTDASRSLWDVRCPCPIALVFGHEVTGIDDDALALCDLVVELPMAGLKNSLNVAIAAGVAMYEVARQYAEQGHSLAALAGERGWGCAE